MTVWVVRAGRRGEGEEFALDNGMASIDFGLRMSVAEFTNRDALRDHLINDNDGERSAKAVPSAAGQLWNFAHVIRIGDMIILPRKHPRVVAVGTAAGAYKYRPDLDPPHILAVDWRAGDIPRENFDQDLLYSLGGLATVYRVRASDARVRIEQIVADHLAAPQLGGKDAAATDHEIFQVDLEEQISDRILDRIRQMYSGVKLEYLVASILRASGYHALETRLGPDGGIDVVAGQGDMGFGQPRLCVQVKSGRSAVTLPEYNQLRGNIDAFGADHGLLVSLGDFTRPVRDANEQSFFQIRLWGPNDLVDKLLETYDSLPDDIQNDIPLRNRRILVETEG
jgi:restriction system protein